MDWTNIDLNSAYERAQPIIDPLSFDSLLLEVNCNLREINRKTVLKQFDEDLKSRIQSAREVIINNLDNIVAHAQKHKEDQ